MSDNPIAHLLALRQRWLPHADDGVESLAMAMHLERRYWDDMTVSVANGIAKVF